MFTRMKSALNDFLVRPQHEGQVQNQSKSTSPLSGYGKLQSAIEYTRPFFLGLSASETEGISTQDRSTIIPKCPSSLPFNAGYCEIVNAGKSVKNEDCAVALTINLESSEAHNRQVNATWDDASKTSNGCDHLPEMDKTTGNRTEYDVGSGQPKKEIEKVATPEEKSDPSEQEDGAPTDKSIKSDQDNNDSNSGCDSTTGYCDSLRFDYFAVFDGHAGPAASLYAAQIVHQLLTDRLREVLHILIEEEETTVPAYLTESYDAVRWPSTKLQFDSLITGIIQEVVVETDKHLEVDRKHWNFKGGCTVLIAVFVLGKMFVAGAGDSRAVMCRSVPATDLNDKQDVETANRKSVVVPMSQDFTPQTERRRLQYLAYLKPTLLGSQFGRLEFVKRLVQSDVGKKVLYRDYHMTGWAYKTVMEEDLKPPMMQGSGKASRLLGTIGVTRGLGDHSVIALNLLENVPIKPFMSPVPEVRVHDFSSTTHHENDVLIMGSDGLWDVVSNEMAAEIVFESLSKTAADDQYRYCTAAKELALRARGDLVKGYWRSGDGRPGSPDDITVFVIPLWPAAQIHK